MVDRNQSPSPPDGSSAGPGLPNGFDPEQIHRMVAAGAFDTFLTASPAVQQILVRLEQSERGQAELLSAMQQVSGQIGTIHQAVTRGTPGAGNGHQPGAAAVETTPTPGGARHPLASHRAAMIPGAEMAPVASPPEMAVELPPAPEVQAPPMAAPIGSGPAGGGMDLIATLLAAYLQSKQPAAPADPLAPVMGAMGLMKGVMELFVEMQHTALEGGAKALQTYKRVATSVDPEPRPSLPPAPAAAPVHAHLTDG